MGLNEETEDVLEGANEIADKIENDLESISNIGHNVSLGNINERDDRTEVKFYINPDPDSLEESLLELDPDYYGESDFEIRDKYQFEISYRED